MEALGDLTPCHHLYPVGDAPNYFPNSFNGPVDDPCVACSKHGVSPCTHTYIEGRKKS